MTLAPTVSKDVKDVIKAVAIGTLTAGAVGLVKWGIDELRGRYGRYDPRKQGKRRRESRSEEPPVVNLEGGGRPG